MAVSDKQDLPEKKGWKNVKLPKVKKGDIKRGVRKIENVTKRHTNQFLFKRWTNVKNVKRLAVGWLILAGLLIVISSLQLRWMSADLTTTAPMRGGTYAEGVVGRLETMNPLFASTQAEQSAMRLIFSSLFDYDIDNKLRANLVDTWSVSEDEKVYAMNLRNDVFWHDGTKMTADDVIFTVEMMQNRATRAIQYETMSAIAIEKVSDYAVKFILPAPYSPFAHSLTFGILPKHILKDVEPANMRENGFGLRPNGTGPFKFNYLRTVDSTSGRTVVHLEANDRYYRGQPLLNRFQIHTYLDRDNLQRAISSSEVNAALGLGVDQINQLKSMPSLQAVTNNLSDGMFAIFNNSSPVLKDVDLRRVLVQGTDRKTMIEKVYGRGVPMDGPLPEGTLPLKTSAQTKYNFEGAAARLDELGWKKEGDFRKKDGIELEVRMVAPKNEDYKIITDELKRQWGDLGIKVTVNLAEPEIIATDYLRPRNYDVLVYELVVGADADVYQYWHSSQINRPNGLNFANYSSGLSDDALSSGRARLDTDLRNAKYKTFYDQWVSDAPAIALYQPMLSYVTNKNSISLTSTEPIADVQFRFRNVERWSVNSETVMTTR